MVNPTPQEGGKWEIRLLELPGAKFVGISAANSTIAA
jgi:hypothetical protein